MKRTLLSVMFAVVALAGLADDYTYPYLVLISSDGTQTAMKVEQLQLTFSNGQLIATNGDGTKTFTLTALRQMAFSESPAVVDAISQASTSTTTSPAEVYTLSGIRMGTFADIETAKSTLKKGIYIVKQNDNTLKISVK